MTTSDDLEQWMADHYKGEAPPRAPNWLLTQALDVIEATPQRRTVFGRLWRIAPMPSLAKLAAGAVAIVAVATVGATVLRLPSVGPAASPSPTASPTAVTATPLAEAAQIIAEGTLASFAANSSGTVLTVWDSCESQDQVTGCGHAWRLGSGPQPRASGMVGSGDVHVHAVAAPGGGFVLIGPGQRGPDRGVLIAEDGTASPISSVCRGVSWPTDSQPGRLVWAGFHVIDTATGACHRGHLGGRSFVRGAFTADNALWALVDNAADPDTLTIGRYDGLQWRYRDLAATGGSGTSLVAAAGSNVVVLHSTPESSPQQLIGLSVTTDAGATWSEVVDPDVLGRDLPWSTDRWPANEGWFADATTMAFAGRDVLYFADRRGDLWRSTDFMTYSRVEVGGWVSGLQSTGDAVIARIGAAGRPCGRPAVCRPDDLVLISADGSVEAITVR